jgi:branched-chain amino acid transport system substrate-binding protein
MTTTGTRTRRGLAVLAAGVAVALGAAACSSSSHARAPATASARGSAYPLGVICSCTGPEASSTSTSAPALEAWADWTNAHGGVNGHPVRLIVENDQTNPGVALAEVERLVSDDHVLAIFDNSDVDFAFESYVAAHHVPVVGSYADSEAMFTNADFFPNGATINWEPVDAILAARLAGARKLAYLYCAEVAICAEGLAATRPVAQRAGIPIVYASAISAGAPSYTAQCLAAKQAGADAMTVGDASAIVVKVADDCAAQGYHPIQLGADGTVAESWRTTPAMNGNIDIQPDIPFFVDSTPATRTMYEAIRRYEPSLASSPNFGEVVVEAWTSGLLFQAAAEAAHLGAHPTPAGVIAGLYELRGDTLGGMAPPLTFTKDAPTTGINCVFLMGIKNATWTLPHGLEPVCPTS